MKSEGTESNCQTCPRDELDAGVCEFLDSCSVLRGLCVYEEVSASSDTARYPDIETRPRISSAPVAFGDRGVEKQYINPDFL